MFDFMTLGNALAGTSQLSQDKRIAASKKVFGRLNHIQEGPVGALKHFTNIGADFFGENA